MPDNTTPAIEETSNQRAGALSEENRALVAAALPQWRDRDLDAAFLTLSSRVLNRILDAAQEQERSRRSPTGRDGEVAAALERLIRDIDAIAEWVGPPLTRSEAGLHAGSDRMLVVKGHRWKSFLKRVQVARNRLSALSGGDGQASGLQPPGVGVEEARPSASALASPDSGSLDKPSSPAWRDFHVRQVREWLLSLSDLDMADIAADGGVTVGMVVQQEAREMAARLAHTLPAPPEQRDGWRPTHRHVKRGTLYRLCGHLKLQTEHPLTDDTYLYLYQDEKGLLWARTPMEFSDGRFEALSEQRDDVLSGGPLQPSASALGRPLQENGEGAEPSKDGAA